ncbi:MAG: superoxide dismutase family protein [Bacillota bacterium]
MFSIKQCLNNQRPAAYAEMAGAPSHPEIRGRVEFYPAGNGVLVMAEICGLPENDGACPSGVFGFHIHEGAACTGNAEDPFSNTGPHFNPGNCAHPAHAGDLPPLFGNDGYAFMTVFTRRFHVCDIIDRTVIIHAKPDDFTTQPSGNSGQKIACGQIKGVCGS